MNIDCRVLSGVELKNVKMSMNPFCENAMEEAVRLKVGWWVQVGSVELQHKYKKMRQYSRYA